jgi:superfamily II DNA or RNA helicase
MAKPRVRITPDGLFAGDLSAPVISRIRAVREMGKVPAFTNEIYDFPRSLRDAARAEKLSAYDYAKRENVLSDYLGRLRDYQTVGAAFLYASPRSMLGDAAGIGKTPQVCATINRLRKFGNTKRVLVAAENSATWQIASEFERFTGLKATVLNSLTSKMRVQTSRFLITPDSAQTEDFDVLVIAHSTLRSDEFYTWFSRVAHEFGTFILDESYVVKNPSTAVSNYTSVLCKKIPRVHFLNATVFETKLLDVVNQFDLCYPGLLPPKTWVERHFCVYRRATFPIRGGGGALGNKLELVSYKNQERFRSALSLVYLTREKKDVSLSEIERRYYVYRIQQSKAQKAAIRHGYRYYEVLNCPSLCPDLNIPTAPDNVPKLRRLIQLVSEDFEARKIVIFAWHVEAQKAIQFYLEQRGRKVAIINGSTGRERDDIREAFNSGDTYDTLVTNIKRSLNLAGGDVCIFYSVETNPAVIEQIAARIDRNVSNDSKTFILLAYEGEEVEFFTRTVARRSEDSRDLTAVASETVLRFGELLADASA